MMNGQRGGILFRLLALVAICAFVAIIYVAWHPLLRAAASFWMVQDRIEPADIIIVIGDDDFTADRAKQAAALFHAGWAHQILASGRMLRPYASVADYIARDLESDGVPPSAILRFSHRADDTLDEAEDLRVVAEDKGWRRILLVTSNYHTRRARYIFRKVLPAGVLLEISSAPDAGFDPATWWESRRGRKLFFLETVGYLQAMWELHRPSSGTPSAAQPGSPSGSAAPAN